MFSTPMAHAHCQALSSKGVVEFMDIMAMQATFFERLMWNETGTFH
jgi:hypothetical protein